MKILVPAAFFLFSQVFILEPTYALNEKQSSSKIATQVFEKAKRNNNWKEAFLTAKHGQVVFMNVSPQTNPNNEIGMETHQFDQIIFIVEGKAKAILNGKTTIVNSGDMIFIPEGTAHNVVNLNANEPLKILSVYSSNDIPADSIYKKKSDTPRD